MLAIHFLMSLIVMMTQFFSYLLLLFLLLLLLLLVRPYLSDFEIFMGATLFIDYYAFK